VIALETSAVVPVRGARLGTCERIRLEGCDAAIHLIGIRCERAVRNLQHQANQLPRLRIRLVAPAVCAEEQMQSVARLPKQLETSAIDALTAELLIACDASLPRLGDRGAAGDSRGHRFAEGTAQVSLGLKGVEPPHR